MKTTHVPDDQGSFEHTQSPSPILPTDQVEIRVQTIACRDLKDVEMGFLGIKSADDQNDVYLKLMLGSWGEVQTDVRDNAGAVASFDYQVTYILRTDILITYRSVTCLLMTDVMTYVLRC